MRFTFKGKNLLLKLLWATPPTFLMWLLPNFHIMNVSMCPSAYCQAFAIRSFLKELLPFVYIYTLKLLCPTPPTVLTQFFTKLSQNDCYQVPQPILSGFCELIVFEGVIAHCLNYTLTLLWATPPTFLMQFLPNFHRFSQQVPQCIL